MTFKPLLLVPMMLCCTTLASAQVETDMAQAEILTGWRSAEGTHMAALRITLAPGWKTFWRAPGDAGIPPRFLTETSANLEDMRTIWPTPDVFDVSGMRAVGYQRELVLPIEITPSRAGADVHFKGSVELGICRDVCVPASLAFDAVLPTDGAADGRITAALVDVPYSADEAGVAEVNCFMGPVQYGLGFRAEIALPQMAGDEVVVVETNDPLIWIAESRSWWEGETLVVETEMSHVERRGFTVERDAIRLTVIGETDAVDIQGCGTD